MFRKQRRRRIINGKGSVERKVWFYSGMLCLTLQRYQFVYRNCITRFIYFIHETWLSPHMERRKEEPRDHDIKQSFGQMVTDTRRLFEMYNLNYVHII